MQSEFDIKIVQITETILHKSEMSNSAKVSSNSGFDRSVSVVKNQSNFYVVFHV